MGGCRPGCLFQGRGAVCNRRLGTETLFPLSAVFRGLFHLRRHDHLHIFLGLNPGDNLLAFLDFFSDDSFLEASAGQGQITFREAGEGRVFRPAQENTVKVKDIGNR